MAHVSARKILHGARCWAQSPTLSIIVDTCAYAALACAWRNQSVFERAREQKSCLASCRFFPSVYYLSTSKIAIAVLGNFAFAAALCLYFLLTKVSCSATRPCFPSQISSAGVDQHALAEHATCSRAAIGRVPLAEGCMHQQQRA